VKVLAGRIAIVTVRRGTPRTEVWRALYGVSAFRADCGKICVAVNDDIIAAAARNDDALRGAVYVFNESGGTWTQSQKLTGSDAGVGDIFGYSVAIEGSTVKSRDSARSVTSSSQASTGTWRKSCPKAS